MAQSVSNLIPDIVANGFCAGCGLCKSVAEPGAISIEMSALGFLRPVIHAPLAGKLLEVIEDCCPVPVDVIWGPLVATRTGLAAKALMRKQGSSGGVISELAAWLIETRQVDFVAQICVNAKDPLRNDLQLSRSRDDVFRAAGSRYAPSAPLGDLRELLSLGEKFALVGKPCDVAALRRYALHDPRVGSQVVCMISFVCAGIPSLFGTHELLIKMGAEVSQLKSFRYRGDGWPGNAKAVQRDGRIFETDYNSSWGTVLNKHLQFRCKICPDGTGESADIVCGDAWYGKDGYPDFTEQDGRSLVLTRTLLGESMLAAAKRSGAVEISDLPTDEISKMQPYQMNRKRMVLGRVIASWLARGRRPIYKNMRLLRASLQASSIEWLRSAWGTYRRAKGESQ
jgi:coenzyme F420 hydrogenase subunit beta